VFRLEYHAAKIEAFCETFHTRWQEQANWNTGKRNKSKSCFSLFEDLKEHCGVNLVFPGSRETGMGIQSSLRSNARDGASLLASLQVCFERPLA